MMMDEMMGKINSEDKAQIMDTMMKDMMSKMMGQMDMTEMYPKCTKMMATKLPKEKRLEMIPKIVKSLVENGSADMNEQEKQQMIEKIIELIKDTFIQN